MLFHRIKLDEDEEARLVHGDFGDRNFAGAAKSPSNGPSSRRRTGWEMALRLPTLEIFRIRDSVLCESGAGVSRRDS